MSKIKVDCAPMLESVPQTKESVGLCVKCSNPSLNYGLTEFKDGDTMTVDYTCRKCRHVGREYYAIEYVESI